MRRVNLYEQLRVGPSAVHAVICTYEFDVQFLECYALEHMRLLSGCETVTVAVDARKYSAVAEDAPYVPRDLNRRYLLQDFPVPGAFHPKLWLFVGEKRAKLLVGSANFTQAALTNNLELMAVITYDADKNTAAQGIFHEAYGFLQRLAGELPDSAFASNVGELAKTAPWMKEAGPAPAKFVHNLELGLLPQMAQLVGNGPTDEFVTVSPFFDSDLEILDEVMRLLEPRQITIVTQQDQDGATGLPAQLLADWAKEHRDTELTVKLIELPEDEQSRRLHGKLHIVGSAERRVCLYGSPNFTSPGLLSAGLAGNVETGILFETCQGREVDELLQSGFVALRKVGLDELGPPCLPPLPPLPCFPIRLLSVAYRSESCSLFLEAKDPSGAIGKGVSLQLAGGRQEPKATRLLPLGDSFSSSVRVTDDAAKLLRESAVRARLVTGDWRSPTPLSNWRWVENLQVGPGRVRPRLYHSPESFDADLAHLLDRGEIDEMVLLLRHCNVPTKGIRRPISVRIRGKRTKRDDGPPPPPPEGVSLGNAVDYFYGRHLRRLYRHLDQLGEWDIDDGLKIGDAMSNFACMFEVMLRAIRYHLEYETRRLFHEGIITPDDWKDARDAGNKLLRRYEEMLTILADYCCLLSDQQLTNNLEGARDLSQLVKQLEGDLTDLVFDPVEKVRRASRSQRIRVRTRSGKLVPPQFFDDPIADPYYAHSRARCREQLETAKSCVGGQ